MKYLIYIILIFCANNLYGQWHQVFDSGDFDNSINQIVFLNSDTGYAINNSSIFQSIDGGVTWSTVYSNADFVLSSISFSQNVGYVMGNIPGNALYSEDAGFTWNLIPGSSGEITDSWCMTQDTCIATKDSGYLLFTDDGWNSFTEQLIFACSFTSVFFTSLDTGYVGGYDCTSFCNIYKTVDRGQTWNCIAYFDLDVYDVQKLNFPTDQTGYALVSFFKVAKSSDYGESWITKLGPTDPEVLFDLSFISDSVGYIVGDLGTGDEFNEYFPYIAKTENGGNSWITETVEDSVSRLLCITCLNDGTCFAGSSDGKIITNKALDTSTAILEKHELEIKVFPNPTDNYLIVKLPFYAAETQIKIVDVNGKVLEDMVFTDDIYFDLTGWTSGVYFVQAEQNGQIISDIFVIH